MGQRFTLEALEDFVAAAEAEGVAAGARRRGAPKQTVSRRLRDLENDLGVRLFDRSARTLRLTPEGALLFERARRALGDLEEMRRAVSDSARAPEGVVRISAPLLLGQTVLGAVGAKILAAYPKLRLDITLTDRRVNLIEEGYDAAIRVGAEEDSSLIARTVAHAETWVVAAPVLIARTGPPAAPHDLARMPCIVFGEGGGEATWTLTDGAHAAAVKVFGRLRCNSLKLCLDAACAGAGFASVPAFLARPALAAGAVVRALQTWRTGSAPVRLVYSSRRLVSARLRAFLDEAAIGLADIAF
ncbi:MAG: LysR substrate-binding domain-containing protein [Hyphomonadaceae bacterium]|nr:LysR substrate-binding domain-containing protein [Hyphomonadaceae bacterium]